MKNQIAAVGTCLSRALALLVPALRDRQNGLSDADVSDVVADPMTSATVADAV